LISAAIAMSIVMLTTFLSYDLINLYKYDKFNLKFNKERLTRLFITSLPLGMVMLLISLNTNIPRYFIEHYVGLKQLGIFTSISYLMVAGTTIVSALGQTASPRLAKYYANGDKKSFIKLILLMIGIAILISVFGICIGLFAGDKLLVLIFNKEFIGYSYLLILIIISAGIGFVASFLGYGLTAIRVFKLQFPIFLCVVFSNAIASYILIPKYGLIGGAVALIIASIINILLVTIILINKLKSDLK
jgi:O-antigen/teichoic acid export membrane protein